MTLKQLITDFTLYTRSGRVGYFYIKERVLYHNETIVAYRANDYIYTLKRKFSGMKGEAQRELLKHENVKALSDLKFQQIIKQHG